MKLALRLARFVGGHEAMRDGVEGGRVGVKAHLAVDIDDGEFKDLPIAHVVDQGATGVAEHFIERFAAEPRIVE